MNLRWFFAAVLVCVWSSTPAEAATGIPPLAKALSASDARPVGWWKLDEAFGTVAADCSGGGHPGTLEGGLSFDKNSMPDQGRRGLKFDGKEGALHIAGFKGVVGPKARTIAAWIRTSTSSGELVSWGMDDHGAMWIFGFIRGHLGVTPKGGYLYMKASVQDDAWHHVAVVVNDASPPNLHDHVQLYRDGVLAEIDDIGLLDLWPIETGDKLDVVVGRGFKGIIADVRLFDRALSEDQIALLAKSTNHKGTAP